MSYTNSKILWGLDKPAALLYNGGTNDRKMTTPNWQHHSRKSQNPHLKPQALRQAKARRQALKRKLEVIR